MRPRSLLALVVVACASGCSTATSPPAPPRETPATPADLAIAPPRERAMPSQAAAAPARVPSWKREIAPWLEAQCASAKGCHGAHPAWSVDLDLRPAAAYKALVDEPAERRLDTKRVKPGDPESSFLVAKLYGRLAAREGKAMPVDPATGRSVTPIPGDPDFLENALVPWIRAGAPNN